MHYHIIGIGGIGMSGLAHLLLDLGHKVTGSDKAQNQVTDVLKERGAIIYYGHDEKHAQGAHQVIYSTAIKQDNPEMQKGAIHRAQFLASMMQDKKALLVTGAHGKTTTSALLAHVLEETSFALGGIPLSQGRNGAFKRGPYFVAEADESDGSFLSYHPYGAIVTNTEDEHLDYWKTRDNLLKGYCAFIESIEQDSLFFWGKDDPSLDGFNLKGTIQGRIKGTSFGFHRDSDLCITKYTQVGWNQTFTFTFEKKTYADVFLPMIGEYNVLNAASVFGLALRLGLKEAFIRQRLKEFKGIKRRVEHKGTCNGAFVIDDYAHHPTEVAALIKGLKAATDKNITVVFEPHRYTRTLDHFEAFTRCFEGAHQVIITDIYPASEEPIGGVTSSALARQIKAETVLAISTEKALDHLRHVTTEDDIILVVGAGTITSLSDKLVEAVCV